MVEQLAQRMKQEPDNLSGWLQLARSQATLGDASKAIQSYTHILSRQKDHLQASIGLAELQVQSGVPEQIISGTQLLRTILQKHPNQPEALWFLGALAIRSGDKQRAIELWERLWPLLPEGSPSRATVKKAIQNARTL